MPSLLTLCEVAYNEKFWVKTPKLSSWKCKEAGEQAHKAINKRHKSSKEDKWNEDDIILLLKCVQTLLYRSCDGRIKWKKIQKDFFPTRTAHALRHRYERFRIRQN